MTKYKREVVGELQERMTPIPLCLLLEMPLRTRDNVPDFSNTGAQPNSIQ